MHEELKAIAALNQQLDAMTAERDEALIAKATAEDHTKQANAGWVVTTNKCQEHMERADQAEAALAEEAEALTHCLCGCPLDEHEICGAGDDGVGCEDEDHVCLFVCKMVADAVADLQAAKAELVAVLREVLAKLRSTRVRLSKNLESPVYWMKDSIAAAIAKHGGDDEAD